MNLLRFDLRSLVYMGNYVKRFIGDGANTRGGFEFFLVNYADASGVVAESGNGRLDFEYPIHGRFELPIYALSILPLHPFLLLFFLFFFICHHKPAGFYTHFILGIEHTTTLQGRQRFSWTSI